jgi:hypothetical protein
MNNAVNKFKNLQKYLKAFTDNSIIRNLPELSDIKDISIYNKIWPIILYVANGNKCNEYYDWNKNKVLNYNRINSCIKIFETLEDLKIHYAVIKGAYLDKIAYKNIGLRFSYDIDILIEKKNYKILHNIMEEYGFVSGEWNNEKKQIEKFSRESMLYNIIHTHQAVPYVRIDKYEGYDQDISVDVNYSISWGEDEHGIPLTSQLLKETQIVEYENLNYRVLNPEAFLMQICMHSYRDMNAIILIKNGKFKLRLLCDVYYYIFFNVNILNADKFINICMQQNYEKYIYYVLYYTKEVFGKFLWIDYVMECIKPKNLSFLNTYGLSSNEIKQWTIDFQDRILCCNLYDIIRPFLTEQDIKKMDIISNNMQLINYNN